MVFLGDCFIVEITHSADADDGVYSSIYITLLY